MARRAIFALTGVAAVMGENIHIGDKLPNVALDYGFPPEKLMMEDMCKNKKIVLMGLPGAFTPT